MLNHTAELGGGELALVRLCRALDPTRTRVRAILFADGPMRARLEACGVPVDVIEMDSAAATVDRYAASALSLANARRATRLAPFLLRLAYRLWQLRPDVVYTNSLKAHLVGIPVALLTRAPLVWHIRDRIADDYLPPRFVQLIRWCARMFPRRVVVNSHATGQTLMPCPTTVAYSGFEADQPIGDPGRHVPPRPPVVGIVGRISPTKGQLDFVRAAALVLRSHPTARFRVIGSPMFGARDYADRVHTEVAMLGIADAVEFSGFAEDPLAALDGLSAFVHASPVPEPFGQVIVEAMIRGVPVIAARGGGATEVVAPREAGMSDDGPFGLLIDPGDPAILAGAICEILDHPDAARARAAIAYRSALARFPIERTVRQVTGAWFAAAGRKDRVE